MATKLTETPAGKVVIIVVAVAAVVTAVFVGIRTNSGDDSKHASDKEVQAAAQRAIDSINSNPNLPPALKAEMIAHNQGMLNGRSHGAGGPPPTGG